MGVWSNVGVWSIMGLWSSIGVVQYGCVVQCGCVVRYGCVVQYGFGCVFSRGVATVSNVEVIHGPVHTIHGLIISTSAKTITRAYRNRVSHR